MDIVIAQFSNTVTVILMVLGLYVVLARGNLIKKLIGLSIFQTSVYLLYVGPGKIIGGTAPIISEAKRMFSTGMTLVSKSMPGWW